MARHHAHSSVNQDTCMKCWMTGVQQMQFPRRQCRPPMSKRRAKAKMFKSDRKTMMFQRIGYETLPIGPSTAEVLQMYRTNNWSR